jgi:hypothetical protein
LVEQSIVSIITIGRMNFVIENPSVALPPYPLAVLLRSTRIMKRPAMFGLTLSLFAFNAFALPAEDQSAPLAQPASSTLSEPLNPVAEDGAQRTLDQHNRVAEDGYDRTQKQQQNRLAEGGAERLAERNQRAS